MAALEGFKDVEGFKVVVYYPKNGVSAIQERQMATQEGKNVKVFGINGNFDNAQTGVKEIFGDEEFKGELAKEGIRLSSANSINIGRLVPQIVYYFYGYFKLVQQGVIKEGEEINELVKELKKQNNMTIISITHDIEEAKNGGFIQETFEWL